MERQLGPRPPRQPILNWEKEAASADFPQIRHFGVAQTLAITPQTSVKGSWVVCTPQSAPDFTAVGFFFGRALYQSRHVPIGLIHSSWGGTPAEAWVSAAGLRRQADFTESVQVLDTFARDPAAGALAYQQQVDAWFAKYDAGTQGSWQKPELPEAEWLTMTLPGHWEKAGLPNFDGVVWFRKAIELPANWKDSPAQLDLGPIDDNDTTWINGTQIGHTEGWNITRRYAIPAGVLQAGRNVITVRVVDTGDNGGIWGNGERMQLSSVTSEKAEVALEGAWNYRGGVVFKEGLPRPPVDYSHNPSGPTLLYNAMIAPLQNYPIRGIIWYQGEANAGRALQYRSLFPDLIADWRNGWKQPQLPFLFVQIAPHEGMGPEIREAQFLTLKQTPKTAMAVTIDIGDARDIHPTNKRPVGERLALAARAVVYDEKIEYSGPQYTGMKADGNKLVLHFSHVGTGLVPQPSGKAKAELEGFTLAGADKIFHPAKAVIEGDTVVVKSPDVPQPQAARYGWANVATGNLFNREGLPASPFRTDWQEITKSEVKK
jgi:sialate O-acetylesterase